MNRRAADDRPSRGVACLIPGCVLGILSGNSAGQSARSPETPPELRVRAWFLNSLDKRQFTKSSRRGAMT